GARLTDLAANRLLEILDPFALIGLRRPKGAYLGRRLAEQLPVDAEQAEPILLDLDLDAFGQIEIDWVRIPERQAQDSPLGLGLVADAVDLELVHNTGGHALEHVLHQRPDQAVPGPAVPTVIRARHGALVPFSR